MAEVDDITRAGCLARAGWLCERCHGSLDRWDGYSLQHRLARGSGGTKRLDINEASWLLVLCGSGVTGCHGWVEAYPALSGPLGYRITSRMCTGDQVPFVTTSGDWWLLDDEFGKRPLWIPFRMDPLPGMTSTLEDPR